MNLGDIHNAIRRFEIERGRMPEGGTCNGDELFELTGAPYGYVIIDEVPILGTERVVRGTIKVF